MGGGQGSTSYAVSREAPHFESPWLVCATGDGLQRFTSVVAGMWSVTRQGKAGKEGPGCRCGDPAPRLHQVILET